MARLRATTPLLLALPLLLVACGGRNRGPRITAEDAGSPDAATDAGSTADGGDRDAGGSDAGPSDAGMDAASPDAGFDAGSPDAGPPDAGSPDAGSTDAGPTDAGASTDYSVGGRARSWTEPGFWRGNVYLAGTSTTLRHFQSYLSLTGSCELGFYVFTSSSVSGPFTRVWSTSRTSSGTGYHDSGPIDLVTTAGTHYTLGVGWTCDTTYYSAEYDTMTGTNAGIGTLQGNASDNGYTGYTTGFTPSGARAGGAHYDQIVTVSP